MFACKLSSLFAHYNKCQSKKIKIEIDFVKKITLTKKKNLLIKVATLETGSCSM